MDDHAGRHGARLWTAVAVMASGPLLFTLCRVLWYTPYPISEAVALLEDAATQPASWFVDPSARSWYRPLYNLTWYGLLHGTRSLDAALWLFRIVDVTAVAALFLLLILALRPRRLIDAAAATFAVAVLAGTPGFRDNLEVPLLMTLVAMPLVLIVLRLLERDRRMWHGPVIIALTLVAIGFKEQGLVLVPLVIVAWWMGAPGIGRYTAAAMVVATIAYLAIRLGASGSWPTFVQDVGFGFTTLSPSQAADRFGRFPVGMYAYSAIATIGNLLFSEPTSGTFSVVAHIRNGDVSPWEINHVMSSAALTGLMAWWGVRTLTRNAGTAWSAESRLVVALVVSIAASGALGFNYTRDRLGGMAVVFYAVAAFFAVRAVAERAVGASRTRLIAVSVGLLLLAGAWQLRAIGTTEHARLTAWKNRREWMSDLQQRRSEFADRPVYLRILEAMVAQGTDPSSPQPTPYSAWTASLVGGG